MALRTSPSVRGRVFQAPALRSLHTLPGVTKDSTGAVLGNCVVHLFRTLDNAFVAETVSDANGNYTFGFTPSETQYFTRMYKVGVPDLAGTSVNSLVGS